MPQSDSQIVEITTEAMQGIVILDPDDPSESARTYLYGNIGRTEAIEIAHTAQQWVTDVYPDYHFSGSERVSLDLNIVVPWSGTHDEEVQALRDFVRARKVLVYRDNRSRFVYGVLTALNVNDVAIGSEVTGTLIVSEYFQ